MVRNSPMRRRRAMESTAPIPPRMNNQVYPVGNKRGQKSRVPGVTHVGHQPVLELTDAKRQRPPRSEQPPDHQGRRRPPERSHPVAVAHCVREYQHERASSSEHGRVDMRHEAAGQHDRRPCPVAPGLQPTHDEAEKYEGEPQAPGKGKLARQRGRDISPVDRKIRLENVGDRGDRQYCRHGERRPGNTAH